MSDPADQKDMAQALGHVPSGLFILTARSGECDTGVLVSWVQQCSFQPPRVSVAIRPDREVLSWLIDGAPFTLNLLADGQAGLIGHFGKGFRLDQPAFTGLDVTRPDGCAPVLADAFGHLLCRVAGRLPAGDHDLLLGDVVGGRLHGGTDGRPYVHIRKNGLRY
jgi:flavin reductase (DIM6/NTAB) family NADH-FMN oxidoreductase RutF